MVCSRGRPWYGLGAGAVALFRGYSPKPTSCGTSHHLGASGANLGLVIPDVFHAAGATVAIAMVRRYAPETSGTAFLILKLCCTVFTISLVPCAVLQAGGWWCWRSARVSAGAQGPTVQMGGAIGDGIAGICMSRTVTG